MSENRQPEELTVELDGSVAIVTLNRPDQLNAANRALHRALVTVWLDLALDERVLAVVLTGAGRAFSAGGDLRMAQASHDDPSLLRVSMEEARRAVLEMAGFPKPIVAAVNGPAVGLGFSLAVLCDIVFMADDTFFADPHVGVGLVAGDGAAMVLPFLTSLMHVKELLWTGDRIPAARAAELGIANRVLPRDQVLTESVAFAHRLAAVPAQALQDTKRAINLPMRQALVASLELAIVAERQSVASDEHADLIAQAIARSGR